MEAKSTSVKREVFIEAPVESVWKALTEPEERNQWETRTCSLELKVGGQVSFDYGWGVTANGTIVELIPFEKITLEDAEKDLTIWTLSPENNGTRVAVEYTGLWLGDQGHMIMENMAYGTKLFLLNLKSVLEEHKDLRSTFWNCWLGITHTSIRPEHFEQYKVEKGTFVLHVQEGTDISNKLFAGDVIIEANHKTIETYEDLELTLTEVLPEQALPLTVFRNGEKVELEITVMAYPVAYAT